MKKGQGNSNRNTIEEACYGISLSGDALNHVRLLSEWDSQILWLKSRRSKTEIQTTQKYNLKLKQKLFASWEKIRHQPESLRKLALVAEKQEEMFRKFQVEGKFTAAYPDEHAMLALYQAEKANGKTIPHQELKEHVLKISPEMTDATFSKKKKQYGLSGDALPKAKPGPKPERKARQ
jgi:hypothetical protein